MADESLRRARDFRSANSFEMPHCWLPIHQEAFLAADKVDEEDALERKHIKEREGAKAKKQKQNDNET